MKSENKVIPKAMTNIRNISLWMEKYLKDVTSISCPICSKNNCDVVGTTSRGGLPIKSVICSTCALIYINPKPTPELYAGFYASGDYRRFLNMVKGRDKIDNVDNYFTEEKYDKRKHDGIKLARTYFRDILGSEDLYFDSGCDCGGIMGGVREETGCVVMGNEPSESCVDFIKQKLGVEILNCVTETLQEDGAKAYWGKIKVLSLIGVLEHMNNPVEGLKSVYEMIMEGGYLYVESFDIFKRMEARNESVEDVTTIDHQYYFHKDVYVYMLAVSGFEVVRFDYDAQKRSIMKVLARKTSSISSSMDYNPSEIINKTLALNKNAIKYKSSFQFLLKKVIRNAYSNLRKMGKRILRRQRTRDVIS